MNRILILFAHPRFEKSRANRALLNKAKQIPEVTLHDLYEIYPDFNIDIKREQQMLLTHDVIIWQHPFYMYGAPAILKQWIDLVLEHGWAHGQGGAFLKDKVIFNSLTTGGSRAIYSSTEPGSFTIDEFLLPFRQTATLCRMTYLPPFAVQGTYILTDDELSRYAVQYDALLKRLSGNQFDIRAINHFPFLNDWLNDGTGRERL